MMNEVEYVSFLLYLNHFMIWGISLLELNATENSFKTSRLHMHSVTDTTCDSFIFSFLFHFSIHITSSCHLMPFLIGPNGFSFLSFFLFLEPFCHSFERLEVLSH